MDMKENGEYTFYIVYSPETCKYILRTDPTAPAYLKSGYYMTALPVEPWGIKFRGNYKNCSAVLSMLTNLNYN